jgi:hypothetical protein
MTLVIPNVIRLVMSSKLVPQLHMDRGFFLTSTVIALVLTFLLKKVWNPTKEALEYPKADNNKKLQLST